MDRINRHKFLQGLVVSDKMNKTRVIEIVWRAKHPQYRKLTKHVTRVKAHDEKNTAKQGDRVRIMECRPLSKDKRWVITEVLKEKTS